MALTWKRSEIVNCEKNRVKWCFYELEDVKWCPGVLTMLWIGKGEAACRPHEEWCPALCTAAVAHRPSEPSASEVTDPETGYGPRNTRGPFLTLTSPLFSRLSSLRHFHWRKGHMAYPFLNHLHYYNVDAWASLYLGWIQMEVLRLLNSVEEEKWDLVPWRRFIRTY